MSYVLTPGSNTCRLELTNELRRDWFFAASALDLYVILVEVYVGQPTVWRWEVHYCDSKADAEAVLRKYPYPLANYENGQGYVYEVMHTNKPYADRNYCPNRSL